MRIAVSFALVTLFSAPMCAQDQVFSDGFELAHPCRWSSQEPLWDCSGAEVTLNLDGGVPLTLVRIPAGTYWMGSPVDERNRLDREDLHQVTLTHDFLIGKYEITQSQWEAVMGSLPDLSCFGGPHGVGPDHPVYCVSWSEAVDFIAQLNTYLNSTSQPSGIRLPTEAEWERAARAGTQTRFSHGDVLECIDIGDCTTPCAFHDQYMWWCVNDDPHGTKPVGMKLSNAFELYDMHGNTYEWVQDWFEEHLGTSPVTNPTGPGSGTFRVLRGGGWPNDAVYCRSANRFNTTPSDYDYYIGFRVAGTAP